MRAQWLGGLALPETPVLALSTHTVAHSHHQSTPRGVSDFFWHWAHMLCTYLHADKALTRIKIDEANK